MGQRGSIELSLKLEDDMKNVMPEGMEVLICTCLVVFVKALAVWLP